MYKVRIVTCIKSILGCRLNNPLNIRYSPLNNWAGQIGQERGFCHFKTVEYGYRAAIKLLIVYLSRGINTPRKIISTWAPASDGNDVDAYVGFVCRPFGWSPDTFLVNVSDLCKLAAMMSFYESNMSVASTELEMLAVYFNLKLKKI